VSRDASGPYRPASPSPGSYGRPRQDRPVSRSVRGGYDGGRSGGSGVDYPTENFPGPDTGGYRPPPGATRDSAGYRAGGGRYGAAGDVYRRGRSDAGHGGGGGRGGERGGGPGRGKVKGSWWRHWTWRKVVGLMAAGFGGLVLLTVAGVSYAYARTSVPTDVSQAAMQQQSTVYFSDGKTPIGTFGSTDRQLLSYDQIPAVVRDAVVAAEDRSFYTEGGVSPRGIVRAAYEDVFNGGGGGGSLQGGSTITQQFVRNYYASIGTQQTASRKINEIFVALKVAKEKSKAWILTNYLNTIYLGQGAYGIGAAAETYFGVPASQLTVAQAAMIAAVIQSPSYYPTPAGHRALVGRWHYVLDGMVTLGDLTAQQAAAEQFPTPRTADQESVGSAPYDGYIVHEVASELTEVDHISQTQLDNGGLHIVTTISKPMMDSLYRAVNQNEKLMAEDGGPLPSYGLVGAELQNPQTGAIVAFYGGRGENMTTAQCQAYYCDLNTAAYTREQVGSSFKPYVLATAVSQGMNVQTSTLDGYSPLWIPPDSEPSVFASQNPGAASTGWFEERNDSDESYGPMTVANAIAQSSNTAFTDLIHRVGTTNVVSMAEQFGVNTILSGLHSDEGHVGMALGQDSLTVDEQDTMLSTLDNNGTYHQAHIVQQVTQGANGPILPLKEDSWQVLTAPQDSQVQYAMSFDTINGTGTAAQMADGRPIIAKTGTTDNSHSAFFIGAIPQYALTVGIFTAKQSDQNQTLDGLGGNVGGGFGGYWPARIWHTFAEDEFASLPIKQFPAPQFTGAAWNMLGPDMMPAATPSPSKKTRQPVPTRPGPRPTVPVTGPFPAPTAVPTCGPLLGTPCNGNGNGNGGPQPGNVIGAGAGLVGLVPLRWLRSRRKGKRR
jgi:membrane peptidoglycan carboxypeptidase